VDPIGCHEKRTGMRIGQSLPRFAVHRIWKSVL
jgi:hypothetical protein